MALERLTLAPVVLGSSREDQDLNNNNKNNNSNDVTINSKAPRLPRWTRQELLVLIQGKRVAENRVRRGRAAVMGFGSSGSQSQVEPKWSSVSSYCKRHGVNRGPVQCRKRWSNLAGDFKKIKEWESRKQQEAEDSFWVMRNDLRRERKLPGFFDREVYDILNDDAATTIDATTNDFSAANDKSLVLSLAPSEVQPEAKTLNNEVVFDNGRTAAAAADGLFSNDDDDNDDNDDDNNDDDNDDDATPEEKHKETAAPPPPTPISATQYNEPFSKGVPPPPPPPPAAATTKDKEATPSPETYQGRKRKRPATNADETSLQNQMIEAMERNGRLLSSQLEIQNTNLQLDREQRQDHANSLFAVLNKLADAMVRIADKL